MQQQPLIPEDETPYVIKHIKRMIALLTMTDKESRGRHIRRDFPYVLHRNGDGTITPLNRYYKPLGIKDIGAVVDYSKVSLYNIRAEAVELPEFTDIVVSSQSLEQYYLYHDDTNPNSDKECLNRYIDKLRLIFKLDQYQC